MTSRIVSAVFLIVLMSFMGVCLSAARAQEDLSDAAWQALSQHPTVMLLIDPETGAIVDANEYAIEFYGYDSQQLLNLSIQDVNQLDRVQVAEEMKNARLEGRNFFVFVHRLSSGEDRTVRVTSVPVVYGGKTLLHSIVHDITDLRELQGASWAYKTRLEEQVDLRTAELRRSNSLIDFIFLISVIFLLCGLGVLYRLYLMQVKSRRFAEKQNARKREVIWATGVATWELDLSTDLLYVNDRWSDLFDVQVVDNYITQASWLDMMHPDDRDGVEQCLSEVLAGKQEPCSVEFRMKAAPSDGRPYRAEDDWVWVLCVGRVLEKITLESRRRMVGTLTDITERKELELKHERYLKQIEEYRLQSEARAQAEKRLRLKAEFLLQNTSDGMCVLDGNGRVMEVSNVFCEMLGYRPDELYGQYPTKWDVQIPEEVIADLIASLKDSGERLEFKTQHKRKDGSIYDASVSARPVYYEDDNFLFCLTRDITARVQLEQSLELAKQEAENQSKAKSIFLASMSHEIRTPMTGVLGMIDLLLAGGDLTDRDRSKVATMKGAAQSLMEIINDILDISKIDAGKMTIEYLPVDLEQLGQQVVELFQSKVAEKALSLSADMSGLPQHVYQSDPTRLRQILINLVGNAIKFTEQGAVTIKAVPQGQVLKFSVSDTGIGISEENLGKLFGDFEQADSTISRRFSGTGLGLAICRRLVKSFGGDIGVDSTEGVGSTFWFTLPILSESAPSSDVNAETHEVLETSVVLEGQSDTQNESENEALGLRVLVAEDNSVNRMVVGGLLDHFGCVYDFAENGVQAVKCITDADYDIVLMDIRMPDMDGLQATRIIRAMDAPKCHVPIVALTADVMPEDIAQHQAAGLDHTITKPIDPNQLRDALVQFGCGK